MSFSLPRFLRRIQSSDLQGYFSARAIDFSEPVDWTAKPADLLSSVKAAIEALPEKERERIFGQSDHLRIFGNDMKELLESVGFKVRVISADDFPPDIVKKHVLFPPVFSSHPLATNHRRVYFAQKPS